MADRIFQVGQVQGELGFQGGDALQEDAMKALMTVYHSLRRNDEGQDLLEYALLVALIALIAIGAVGAAGTSVNTIFNNIATKLAAAA